MSPGQTYRTVLWYHNFFFINKLFSIKQFSKFYVPHIWYALGWARGWGTMRQSSEYRDVSVIIFSREG